MRNERKRSIKNSRQVQTEENNEETETSTEIKIK